jgi:RNA ligase
MVKGRFTDWESLGNIRVVEHNNMLLFSYKRDAEWNDIEIVCRGLIIEKDTGRIIARPFDKFFNWLERGRKGTGHITAVHEKMDGSLGIVYRDPTDKKIKVATRGNFESDQALWATKYLNDNYEVEELPVDTHTLMVEIIYPDNRIVVDYGRQEKLVLLAVRHMLTGNYIATFPSLQFNATKWGFELPANYSFGSLIEIIEATGKTEFQDIEGWVIEMSDGSRWKFKTDQYVELHRIISSLTPKNILKKLQQPEELAKLIGKLPEPYATQTAEIALGLVAQYAVLRANIFSIYDTRPGKTHKSRKKFAKWVIKNHAKYSAALFDLYDNKPITQLILDKYMEI